MTSRKDIFSKYYVSDIFNRNPEFYFSQNKPRLLLNRSTLENTKEDVFNIGKERRINRNNDQEKEKQPILSQSAEKRKKNLSRIYGSDIFNTKKSASIEKRKGKQQFKNITTNRSTCFEGMKNNDEYIKELKYYTKKHHGEKKIYNPGLYIETVSPQERYYDSYYGHNCEGILPGSYLKSEGNIDEYKLNYIKKKMHLNKDERLFNDVGVDKKRKEGEKAPRENRYPKNNLNYLYKSDKRRFVDEYPENNCKINKQIQFESHIFSNNGNSYIKTNQEIEDINERIVRERNKHYYHLNALGQPIIRVNRNINIKNPSENKVTKLRPADLNWNSPKAEVMFGSGHESDIYKTYGKKGPNSYQLKLYQFSDSGNRDTLSGEPKTPYLYMKRPKKDEIVNDEVSRNIEKMVNNIPNLNDRQKLEIKQKTSVLDCKSDDEWNNKSKTLKDFYKKGNKKLKNKEIAEKPNNMDKKINGNKDAGYHDYVIRYSLKGNQFDKFEEHEIKNMFGKKGINVYDIHKNPFVKGSSNTINLKVSGYDTNNQITEKIKLIQDDLIKKKYKISIEKDDKNKKKSIRRMMNQNESMGEFPKTTVNAGGTKFKIMPPEYKSKRGFIKEFSGINYGYKKLPQ